MNTIDINALTPEQREELQRQLREQALKDQQQKKESYLSLKNESIVFLCTKAKRLHEYLKDFKRLSFENMDTLHELLREYSGRASDSKGSFKIESENFKIEYCVQGRGTYDERATEAERFIFEFIEGRYSGDVATKEFILSLLERKNGDLDHNNIQKLYQYEDKFDDETFSRACALFRESYNYAHSKDYIRFYEKNKQGKWQNIVLQFSAV